MHFFNWLRSILFRSDSVLHSAASDAKAPTPEEMQVARKRLDEMVAKAILGEIGGDAPDKRNRAASWWGGNFLGERDEAVPVCSRSGRTMHPVLQIRVDELPEVPTCFEGLALINLWMDLKSDSVWGARNGDGFTVRTYDDLKPLVPLGFGYRESSELPTFPVFWRETILEQPSWEDMVGELPQKVARARNDDWFFKSRYMSDRYDELCNSHPIKVGGWPTWIQGSDWPDNATFFFQVDSNDKGKLYLGDSGSFYIFRTEDGWEIRGDCF